MKVKIGLLAITITFLSCGDETAGKTDIPSSNPMEGTWQLVQGTVIEHGDTTSTDFTQNVSFIKIINDTHFAFLQHDLDKGKDTAAVFVAGGGSYSLKDTTYTEHLEYCSAREWEGNDFTFTIDIQGDTLIQKGIEQVESAGIKRINIEKYVRAKK